MSDNQAMKESLYTLYAMLKEVAGTKGGEKFFAPEVLKHLDYSRKDVKAFLDQVCTEKVALKPSKAVAKSKYEERIKNKDDLHALYYTKMIGWFDPSLPEKERKSIEKAFTIADLKYLYTIITTAPVPHNVKKPEMFKKFKKYYDNEVYTADMKRKQLGK